MKLLLVDPEGDAGEGGKVNGRMDDDLGECVRALSLMVCLPVAQGVTMMLRSVHMKVKEAEAKKKAPWEGGGGQENAIQSWAMCKKRGRRGGVRAEDSEPGESETRPAITPDRQRCSEPAKERG